MLIDESHDQVFQEVYESTLAQLRYKQANDTNFSTEEIEGQLDSLYIYQGQDWVGRGSLSEVKTAAAIAAFETFLSKLKG